MSSTDVGSATSMEKAEPGATAMGLLQEISTRLPGREWED